VMDRLLDIINKFRKLKFTGELHLTIVFNQGGIRTIKNCSDK
jgi:hypothetical protein